MESVYVLKVVPYFLFSQSYLGSAIDILYQNWVSILVTIGVSILTVYSTNRLVKKLATNARQERFSQAKGELIRILEEHVINNKEITPDRVDNLIAAVEREHSVDLSTSVSKVTLLQDLQYNIEDSTHLSIEQKEEYSENIESTIIEIKESNQSTTKPFDETISELRQSIKEGNEDEALSYLEDLGDSIEGMNERYMNHARMQYKSDKWSTYIGAASIVAVFSAMAWIVSDTFDFIETMLPIVIILIVTIYAGTSIFYTYVRTRMRS